MRFIDWFAGIGGFRRGMELAGHECVGFCEFDKFAVASYTSMHLITEEQRAYLATLPLKERQKEIQKEEYRNGEWFANDVRAVHAGDIPDADCYCFGFPCVDISVAGLQKGFSGERSSLFFEVMRILDERKEDGLKLPDYLFVENVKNLLSVSRGFDFAKVLFALDERGYDAEWSVLNSKDFSVPQNKERVFVIGHLRGRCTTEVFPVEGTDGENCVYGIGHRKGYRRNTQVFDRGGGLTEALSTCQGGGREHHTIEVIGINTMDDGSCRTLKNQYQKNSAANFTQQGSRGATRAGIEVIGKAYERDNYGDNRNRILGPGGAVPSLTATQYKEPYRVGLSLSEIRIRQAETSCNQGIFVQISENLTVYAVWYPKKQCYIAIRKLTPKECFRLQAWDDVYFERAQFVNSDSQLYKQAGNGVTVNVIKAIAEKFHGEEVNT